MLTSGNGAYVGSILSHRLFFEVARFFRDNDIIRCRRTYTEDDIELSIPFLQVLDQAKDEPHNPAYSEGCRRTECTSQPIDRSPAETSGENVIFLSFHGVSAVAEEPLSKEKAWLVREGSVGHGVLSTPGSMLDRVNAEGVGSMIL